jgi:hypothetical protein
MRRTALHMVCLFLLSVAMSISSCVDPIVPDLNISDLKPALVVDGRVTDAEGPFTVKLSNTIGVDEMYYNDPVLDADVRIIDDKGNSYQLFGNDRGVYQTAEQNIRGVPGNSYTLSVTTSDGRVYESSSVLMEEVPEIDSLYFSEGDRTTFEGDQPSVDKWLTVMLDSHDPLAKTKHWYFEFEETWEVKLITENVSVQHSMTGDIRDVTVEDVDVSSEKQTCWVTKSSGKILIASTAASPADEIKKFELQMLGPDEDKLHIRYSILVRQASIGSDEYNFWKQLKDLNQESGGLYEKMPDRVFGNISCCDGKSRALGYFSAMSVKTKRIFIDRNMHEVRTRSAYADCHYYDYVPMPSVPKSFFGIEKSNGKQVYCNSDFCADCQASGTNVKPAYW